MKLEEAKQAHSEEKQRWLLSSVTTEEEAKARQDDAADAAEKAKEADCLRLSLEEELQKIRNEMAALTVHKDDLLKQVADSDEATIADQRKHHEELINCGWSMTRSASRTKTTSQQPSANWSRCKRSYRPHSRSHLPRRTSEQPLR